MTYDSIAEGAAAPAIAALGGKPCHTFAPHLPTKYMDAAGEALTGEPDFVVLRGQHRIYLEWKAGKLNHHYTRASSHEALEDEYRYFFRSPPEGKSHSALSNALYHAGRSGKLATLAHGFNHSLWKVLALQARHGWRNYVVCFKTNPKPEDAERYCAAGLVWCTLETLPQLLLRIELEAAGFPISFVHRAQKFSYEVQFDNGTATAAEVRTRFFAAVAADKAAIAAGKAEAAADEAAGISPF
jgi:hypothetical protein